MASIQKRVLTSGEVRYVVQIKLQRGGEVHKENHTFKKRADARQFADMREAQLRREFEKAKALEGAASLTAVVSGCENGVAIPKMIELYEEKAKPLKKWGKSKQTVLNTLKKEPKLQIPASSLDAQMLIDYALYRIQEHGVSPATVNCDLSYLRSVYSVAENLLGVEVTTGPFQAAQPTLKTLGLAAKSRERDRRPMVEEMTDIVSLMYATRTNKRNRWRTDLVPHDKITVFAMFSGRRREEISHMKWANLDKAKKQILLENVKTPNRATAGQYDTVVTIPDEAFAVIESMPEAGDYIFPFNYKTYTSGFTRARKECGLNHEDDWDNLHFHDLRHECFSWLAEKNGLEGEYWDLVRIRQVSGHKSFKQLERYINQIDQTPADRWKDWEWKTKVLE